MNRQGVETRASFYAGTHVCNSVMYVLHSVSTMDKPPAVGFVHVPFPNEFSVVEDWLWQTASFPGIIKSSVVLVESLRDLTAARAAQ